MVQFSILLPRERIRAVAVCVLIFFSVKAKAQFNCFCDTTALVNYVDTVYFNNNDTVAYRIDRDSGKKYFIKTLFRGDTIRLYSQINDSLQENGESCAWFKSGQLKYRLVYNKDRLVGSNNYRWYKNGAFHSISSNIRDTIRTLFFSEVGRLSYEETEFGGILLYSKQYCVNGNVREFSNYKMEPVLVASYYCSGMLKSIYHLWYSKPVGDYVEYYDDGSVKEKGTYKKGDQRKKTVFKKYQQGDYFESIKTPSGL